MNIIFIAKTQSSQRTWLQKNSGTSRTSHSCESGNPVNHWSWMIWIPAFAGMTDLTIL